MAKKEDPMYLVNPDTQHVELVHGDDVEGNKAAGWKEPTHKKANGEDWNTEDNLAQRRAAADGQKAKAESDAKKQAARDKETQAALKAADKAHEDVPPHADLKVEIVNPQQ